MSLTEDELIARYFAPIAGAAGLALKDDVARLTPPPGRDLVLTVDALVAGVHFFADDAPERIAAKSLRVNLSDLAAKGATPLGFLLALALPGEASPAWLEAFAQGLGEDAQTYGCPLLGGDTVKTPGPLTLSITAFGSVAPGPMPVRTQARPGDLLFVTGTIGDAALGLALRRGGGPALAERHRAHLIDRYLLPQPRLGLAAALRHADAAMDVSDGLVGDLAKMLRASEAGGELDLREAPLSEAARAWIAAEPGGIEIAATGGDDYEVLAAVPPDSAPAFEAAARQAHIPVRAIGRVTAGSGLVVTGLDGQPTRFARAAYSHF
ncbi:MAG: thiamine-phosphate kinase [Pseudomonadota bacterium]|nr:thiamine-phosphate kinase [Pseudomonadota bacterium]